MENNMVSKTSRSWNLKMVDCYFNKIADVSRQDGPVRAVHDARVGRHTVLLDRGQVDLAGDVKLLVAPAVTEDEVVV